MRSPLEEHPKILEKIGLFIVLFNIIDTLLNVRFYFIIIQTDKKNQPIMNNLISQDFSRKLDALENVLGEEIHSIIKDINEFRNFIAHGSYGMNELKGMSITKVKRYTGKYQSVTLSEKIMDEHIENERKTVNEIYKLNLLTMQQGGLLNAQQVKEAIDSL